jgi:ribosomal protein S18 acetylase RimI-like enzyme
VRLRRARLDEAATLAEVFGAARAGMTYLPQLHTPEEDRWYFGEIALASQEIWVAEEDDRVLGFTGLTDDLMSSLYVRPEAQGRGVGTALMEKAKERRPDGFSLWVFQQNGGARRFYERHGFRLVRETDGADNEERVPDALYEWRPPAAATR